MTSHEDVLCVLNGLRLQKIGRAADMLWMHFGDLREAPSRRGGTRQVGEWSLHIQTSWRFTRRDRIIVGVLDLYASADDGSGYDWDRGGESRFDRIASSLNKSFQEDDIRVRQVFCDEVGSITLRLDTNLHFAVFPNFSSDYPNREYWRFFRPATDDPHHVVGTEAQ
jgi:hypothetical protein